jgi:hypothetical protein
LILPIASRHALLRLFRADYFFIRSDKTPRLLIPYPCVSFPLCCEAQGISIEFLANAFRPYDIATEHRRRYSIGLL